MEQKVLSKWLKVILIGAGICGLFVDFAGAAVAVASAALSHLVRKAAVLQEQSDLTI